VTVQRIGIFRSDDGGANWINISSGDATLNGIITLAQNNNAEIVARATFDGAGGHDVTTSATAYGNTVSGLGCTQCGGVMQAESSQISTANVSAITSTSLSRGRARTVSGASSAVGNSATFVVQSGN